MKIKSVNDVPDSTYFNMSDVTPVYNADADTITIFNGEGTRRSWGKPRCESTVVFRGKTLIAIHVGFSHKHRGGQGWHYFTRANDTWKKVAWGALVDSDRKKVLKREDNAPSWAKSPGKLRKERKSANQNTRIAYKIVRKTGDDLISLYDGETIYKIGKRLSEKAQHDHNGGFYSYSDPDLIKLSFDRRTLIPERIYDELKTVALLKVEIAGRTVEYSNNKIASTYIKPLEIVEVWNVQ